MRTYVRTYYTITDSLCQRKLGVIDHSAGHGHVCVPSCQWFPKCTSAHLCTPQTDSTERTLIILLHFTFFFFPPLDFFSLFSWFGIVRGPLEQARKEEVLLLGFIIPDLFLLLGIFFSVQVNFWRTINIKVLIYIIINSSKYIYSKNRINDKRKKWTFTFHLINSQKRSNMFVERVCKTRSLSYRKYSRVTMRVNDR